MKLRLTVIAYMLIFLTLFLSGFVIRVESGTSTNKLYAHAETTTIGGVNYYLHKLSSADGPATTLSASATSTGRKLMGRWVYPLSGIISIPASTWTVTYRAMKSSSATSVVAHCDVDILIRKSDNTNRTTIATNVANSPTLTLVNTWQTLTGTYNWASYTVVDQTDYLEVAYYIEVTTPQSSKSVRLLVDDGTLPLVDQTKIENVMFTYPNQAPVASFTFSPSNPLINDTVTFDASASYDPDGSIVSYIWDFGDGNVTTVTSTTITHVYPTATSTVNYTVTLTVTDNEGSTGLATQIVPVTNPAILDISLPAGTYHEPHEDHWLSQCWLLNITGLSGTFTVRINDIHPCITSYDTHLVIALNDTAYQYLDSLIVGATTIPKASFTNSTPTPYGYTLTWEEDVYPTWFSDIYVVGIVGPKSYIDVQISVNFTSATNVAMHFDAYGSTDSPPPPKSDGHITHNPHEKDSTVLFSPSPVVQYYLTVTSPYGTVGGQGWYVSGTTAYASLNTGVVDHGNGTRRVFLYWSGDASGTNYAQSDPILMDGNKTAIAVWKTQYYLTVTSPYGVPSGLDWYDSGTNAYASLDIDTVDHGNGTRRVFTNWSGDASGTNFVQSDPILMNAPKTAIANWKTQYQITVTATPAGTLGGTFKVTYTQCGTTYTNLQKTTPWTEWVDSGTTVTVSEPQDVIDVSPGIRYKFDHYDPSASLGMDNAKTITLVYKTQYYLTVNTNPAEVLTLNPAAVSGQGWYDSGFTATVDAVQNVDKVSGQSQYDFRSWTGATQTGVGNHATVFMDGPKTATANYQLQYYLTVTSPYGSPSPTSGWFDAGTLITASVTSPWPGPAGTRYVCTGWTGTGSVPASGTTTSIAFTINEASSITWNWITQYYLTVKTDPTGIATIPGEGWYNESTSVTLTAPTVPNYQFSYWDVDGMSQGSGVNPTTVTMNAPHTATAYYIQIVTYTLTITTTTGGTTNPSPGTYTYTAGSTVQVTAIPDANYVFDHWELDTVNVGSANPYTVLMDKDYTLKAVFVYSPPLSVSISPLSASINVGQSVTFTSTVSGGTSPYSYQWYLDDAPVSGATSSSWTFTPTTTSIHYVKLKVTDSKGNTAQSDPARITVSPKPPVGGYSVSLSKPAPTGQLASYMMLIALFGATLSLVRRKRK